MFVAGIIMNSANKRNCPSQDPVILHYFSLDNLNFNAVGNNKVHLMCSNSTFNGPWALDCGAGGFTVSGTLTRITCPAAPSAAAGPVAGE